TGCGVTVPTLPGLTRGRLRPAGAAPVVAALATRPGPWAMVRVSIGAAPAFAAAADPRVRDRVGVLLALGPHASAAETLRFWLTGAFDYGGASGRVPHDPALVRAFVDANADPVADATRAALAAGDVARIEPALAGRSGARPPKACACGWPFTPCATRAEAAVILAAPACSSRSGSGA